MPPGVITLIILMTAARRKGARSMTLGSSGGMHKDDWRESAGDGFLFHIYNLFIESISATRRLVGLGVGKF